jgi:glycerol-3-phosphate cytidylyltransferase
MKVGVIAGSFDVIHPGYIYMFEECKANCDHFMVLLHVDPSIERPDKLKPILSLYERIKILYSISMIDHIVPYDTEEELLEYLMLLKPAVRFLGDDYKDKSFTGDHLDIPIHYINRDHGWSTTKFKKAIADEVQRSSNI